MNGGKNHMENKKKKVSVEIDDDMQALLQERIEYLQSKRQGTILHHIFACLCSHYQFCEVFALFVYEMIIGSDDVFLSHFVSCVYFICYHI